MPNAGRATVRCAGTASSALGPVYLSLQGLTTASPPGKWRNARTLVLAGPLIIGKMQVPRSVPAIWHVYGAQLHHCSFIVWQVALQPALD
jgi:hypothetical protein